jgi:hypothetical protein
MASRWMQARRAPSPSPEAGRRAADDADVKCGKKLKFYKLKMQESPMIFCDPSGLESTDIL